MLAALAAASRRRRSSTNGPMRTAWCISPTSRCRARRRSSTSTGGLARRRGQPAPARAGRREAQAGAAALALTLGRHRLAGARSRSSSATSRCRCSLDAGAGACSRTNTLTWTLNGSPLVESGAGRRRNSRSPDLPRGTYMLAATVTDPATGETRRARAGDLLRRCSPRLSSPAAQEVQTRRPCPAGGVAAWPLNCTCTALHIAGHRAARCAGHQRVRAGSAICT